MATTHVPYSIYIELHDADLDDEGLLRRLQGNEVGAGCELLIIVAGSMPDLGTSMTEIYRYRIPDDFERTPFVGVDVDYELRLEALEGMGRLRSPAREARR